MSVNPMEPAAPEQPNPSTGEPIPLHQKYGGDWTKANQGYFNAVTKLGEVHQALQQERARAEQMTNMLQAIAGGGSPQAQNPFAELEQLGVPAQQIQSHLESTVAKLLEDKLGTMFNPIVSAIEAEEQLAGEIENFDQHKADARRHMKENPEVLAVFNATREKHPAEAWKYAIREMLIAKQAGGNKPLGSPPGLPGGRQQMTGRGNETQAAPLGPDQMEREKQALEYGRQYGDMSHYSHERYKGTSIERQVRAAMRHLGLEAYPEGSGW